jgi:pyruvate ferredoxin oxidoreductase gamma subunit
MPSCRAIARQVEKARLGGTGFDQAQGRPPVPGLPSQRSNQQAAGKLPMFQVRIHGRGGQGVVTGAEMLSVAAFYEGRHAQAFPSFGSERTGAPVVAFCRIADKEIRLREPILEPDCLIVQDPTLFKVIDVFAGLRGDGYLLVNTNKTFAELHIGQVVDRLPKGHAVIVPATEFAMTHVGRPVPNAALLGAFAGLTQFVRLESVEHAIEQAFPGKVGAANVAAAREAHEFVVTQQRQSAA